MVFYEISVVFHLILNIFENIFIQIVGCLRFNGLHFTPSAHLPPSRAASA